MLLPSLPAGAARRAGERAAELLARDPRVQLVYLFGSANDPSRATVRDVDVAALFTSAVALEELMRLRAELVLATGAPIDLVSLNDAPVALAHEVVEGGRCLHAKDPDVETSFVVRTRARYWDFKPFRETQWRLAGERLEERRRGP
jgi:predicted nucleotidyltransferase